MVNVLEQVLTTQAEKIVNAEPGSFKGYTLTHIKEIIHDVYTLEKLRRLKPKSELWNWLLTFNYVMRSDCLDPSMYGVCELECTDGIVSLKVSCYDYHHWQSLPSTVEYKSYLLMKRGWDAIDNTCRYMNTNRIAPMY